MKLVANLSLVRQEEDRNASLDGVRAVAVLLILLYHHSYLNSGWIGVDLFFVLSGYLITRILRQRRSEPYFWRQFWTRRAARILPPVAVALLATHFLSFEVSPMQGLAYLLSLGDWLALIRPNFDALRPLWSLAVEEHFYMAWPFAIRLLAKRRLVVILLCLVGAEPVVRALTATQIHDWQFIYFLTPFRLDGLGLGSLLAITMESERYRLIATRWSSVGLVVTAGLWLLLRRALGTAFTRENPTPLYSAACYSLISLAAFFCIAYILNKPNSIIPRILSHKSLVLIGRISYGIYLYQNIVRETIMRTLSLTPNGALLFDAPLTFAVAFLSFHALEQPVMRLERRMLD